jgi:hypothetical protein
MAGQSKFPSRSPQRATPTFRPSFRVTHSAFSGLAYGPFDGFREIA